MKKIGELLPNMPPRIPDDPDDTKYSLVMHGLCKKYGIKEPLERHIFSIIENMSRYGRPCLYTLQKFVAYSGGSERDIESTLQRLESNGIIARTMLKTTKGWKLTEDVQKSAVWFKEKIGRFGKDRKSHN